jgi:hypothetical protein
MNKLLISILTMILIGGSYVVYITLSHRIMPESLSQIWLPPVSYRHITPETTTIDTTIYPTVWDFLTVLDTNTGSMTVDIMKEDFYIMHTDSRWTESVLRVDAGFRTELMSATGSRKDMIIRDIFTAYQSGGIMPESTDPQRGGIKMLAGSELDTVSQAHNKIVSANTTSTGSFYATKKQLESTATTDDNKKSLAYMYEYEGDYAKALALRSTLSGGYTQTVTTHIEWKVTDGKTGTPLSGVIVELLNDKKTNTKTDATGKYTFDISLADSSRYRLRAWDPTHSDGFAAFSTFASGTTQSVTLDFTIHTPDKVMDVTLSRDVRDGMIQLDTAQTIYTIPVDGLVFADGTLFHGDQIRGYMYEFTKETNMANYMYNDTFDAVYGYVGNIMKTFGMPYLQIYDTEGNELHIRKSKPALLHNKIYHMKALYDNYDHIYTAITDEDMAYLVAASKTDPTGFPITRAWLIDNHMLKWPSWWCLNRTKWVWEAVGQRVIDPSGVIETQYYTID